MTTTPQTVPEIRKTYLDSLNQAQNDTKWLRIMLTELEKCQPMLFDSDAYEALEAINQDKTKWTHAYFSKQKKQAEQGFSRERVCHLLDVREFFRERGDKGFVPKALPFVPNDKQEGTIDYSPSNNLRMFVEEGNIFTIRAALRMAMIDRRMENHDVRQALVWVKTRVPNLCEVYVEKAFSREMDQDRSHWNTEYFFTQEEYLETVFSEERFMHMVDVREHLRQQGVEGFTAITGHALKTKLNPPSESASSSAGASSFQREHSDEPSTDQDQPFVFKVALWIGGAIAALVTLILSLRK
jgi:hypothetical protein